MMTIHNVFNAQEFKFLNLMELNVKIVGLVWFLIQTMQNVNLVLEIIYQNQTKHPVKLVRLIKRQSIVILNVF